MKTFMQRLKESRPLSSSLSKTIKLQNTGARTYKGLCPFHSEKTPSFFVDDDKGLYYCFGCNEGGDIFNFVMKTENIPLKAAVKKIAEELGIELPEECKETTSKESSINVINATAANWFFLQIDGTILAYFRSRGITNHQDFLLGYAPQHCNRLITNLRESFSDELIMESGLINKHNNCLFSDRIMFPIINEDGVFVGFGGRVWDQDSPYKYINTPNGILFHKKQVLYGIYFAKSTIQSKNQAIVVEGYLDVIAMHRNGFRNTVGCMGSSLSTDCIMKLWSIADEIILMLDNDKAGTKSTIRTIMEVVVPLIKTGKTIKILEHLPKKDPEEFLQYAGPDGMKAMIKNATTITDYLYWQAKKKHNEINLKCPEERAILKKELHENIHNIKDIILKKEISREFGRMIFLDSIGKIAKKENISCNSILLLSFYPKWLMKKYPEIAKKTNIEEYTHYIKIYEEKHKEKFPEEHYILEKLLEKDTEIDDKALSGELGKVIKLCSHGESIQIVEQTLLLIGLIAQQSIVLDEFNNLKKESLKSDDVFRALMDKRRYYDHIMKCVEKAKEDLQRLHKNDKNIL